MSDDRMGRLVCTECQRAYPWEPMSRCPHCQAPLDVSIDVKPGHEAVFSDPQRWLNQRMWAFRDFLPVRDAEPVTLGEGVTPLLPLPKLRESLGREGDVWLKDESRQPTGSFKDRPISVAITKAVEFGREVVAILSSGNAGGSAAVYAARAGLKCVIIVPANTPAGKLGVARAAGARIVLVRGDLADCYRLLRYGIDHYQWYDVTTTFANPYSAEADKTVAYELALQLDFQVPDWILVPVGSGPLLTGVYKGFRELQALGLVKGLPRMVAVQAEGCAPIVRAFQAGRERVEAWDAPGTIATGIRDPLWGYTKDGDYTLRVVRESGGVCVSVPDAQIAQDTLHITRLEGMYMEPTAAVCVSALRRLAEQGIIRDEHSVVLLGTGHGLKDYPPLPEEDLGVTLDPTQDAFEQWIQQVMG